MGVPAAMSAGSLSTAATTQNNESGVQEASNVQIGSNPRWTMNGRLLVVLPLALTLAVLSACNGIDKLPGTGSSGGALTVQFAQSPPATMQPGQSVGLEAIALNDSGGGSISWSCAPAGLCGTFSPSTTGYQITTLYTAPVPAANTPVTITATSVTDSSKSASGSVTVLFGTPGFSGAYIFSDFGFTSTANGGEQGSAGGQLSADGNGNITGIMDLNSFGTVSTLSLTGSTYAFSGGPRGTVAGPAGQTYNIYLTDPALNLLDPNNPTGGGGALLLETDSANTIGMAIPQTTSSGTLTGSYAIMLSDQSNPPNADGGFTGEFTVSSGTFSGEGDFQGQGPSNATPIVGPLTGTFAADSSNPGRFSGTITTAPAFPLGAVGSTTPGTEDVSFYVANDSQAFVEETDSIAPVFGVLEAQPAQPVTTAMLKGQYAFVVSGYASLGMVGSITLDGNGNVTGGEADWSQNGAYSPMTLTGTYSLDSTGHGYLSLNLINTIYGTFPQTHGITAISSSHLVIAEEDQFNGLTIGGVGSMDLQASAPNFSASQVSGGYSFTLAGYDGAKSANGSWGGIFTADGVSGISGGIYDTSLGAGLSSMTFTGTFAAPDSFGRGTLDLTNGMSYAYYIVTPEVLRLTTINDTVNTNTVGTAANTGSAFGQGPLSPPGAAARHKAGEHQRRPTPAISTPDAKQRQRNLVGGSR